MYQNPPPAHSPPLHHPVPQHVSTVPQLRSPPPPQPPSQPQSGYGYAQQHPMQGQQGPYNANMPPAFGGFINDPTAQLGFQMGKTAMNAGQEYVEQNVRVPIIPPRPPLYPFFRPLIYHSCVYSLAASSASAP